MITTTGPSALACYDAALTGAVAVGTAGTPLLLVDPAGARAPVVLHPTAWCGPVRPGDGALLDRCHGATLDFGCGPGRLTEALAARGVTVLGVDISVEAIRQARRRGAPVRRACALTTDLGSAWHHVLLADGNIGIGGDPVRLLSRCRELLAPGGDVLVELDPPGGGSWAGPVTLRHDGVASTPFAWAVVAIDDFGPVAARAGLLVAETWTEEGRWFVRATAG